MAGYPDSIPVLQPPPVPPRRRSPIDETYSSLPTSSASVNLTVLNDHPVPAKRSSILTKDDKSDASIKPSYNKTMSVHENECVLISLETHHPPRPFSVEVSGSSTPGSFLQELEGIDFTPTSLDTEVALPKNFSSSMEDLVQKPADRVYPDISGAFRNLRTSIYPEQSNFPDRYGALYGWNASVYGVNGSNQLANNVSSGGKSEMYQCRNNSVMSSNVLAVCPSMPKAASWASMSQVSSTAVGQATAAAEHSIFTDLQIPDAFQQDQNTDLIHFKPVLPEHEYLSLDYFDPLYEQARQGSVCSADKMTSGLKYSFGEAFPSVLEDMRPPPALRRHIRRESHEIWGVSTSKNKDSFCSGFAPIGFEALTVEEVFGSSDATFLQTSVVEIPSRDATEGIVPPPHPPISSFTNKQAGYDKLRKRVFVDPDSDAFCQMVAELKKNYSSTDPKTNPGYLLSPIHTSHTPSMQVKVIIQLPFDPEPLAFTCDTDTLVEHVISQVLYSASPTHGHQESACDFLLKVNDRMEYLDNMLPLSKFEYVHHCLKLDQDITFQMVKREQVMRPFIRTVDDDEQMLVFPREYIKTEDAPVSMESLDILLDNLYKAVDMLSEQAAKGIIQRSHMQSFTQSIKAVCAILAKIETINISKALSRLEKVVSDLSCPDSQACDMTEGNATSADRDTIDAVKIARRYSLLEDLQEVMDQVVSAVQQLVRMYCQTYHTNFYLGSSVDIPHNQTEVTAVQDTFIVHIASAHRLPPAVLSQYEEFKVICTLYHGTHHLYEDKCTSCKKISTTGLCEQVVWDEWLEFGVNLSLLPREVRLCIMLVGLRYNASEKSHSADTSRPLLMPVGAASVQLYSQRSHLLQGSHLVPLTMGATADPTLPTCRTLLPDSILLQVSLPDFDKTIYFPPTTSNITFPDKEFESLLPEIQQKIVDILEKDYTASVSADDLEIVWQYRHYLRRKPTCLPRILQAKSSHGWHWETLADLQALLATWPPLHPTQAFELLLPQYPDLSIREFAADSLSRIPADDLLQFLPQLIQGLKFQCYHNSPLARLLLQTSCKSIRFAHQLFWLLKGVAGQEASYKRRYELMFVALASVAGDTLYQEFRKQEELVKSLTSVAEKVKASKDKDLALKRELQGIFEFMEAKGRLLLPYNPSLEITSIDMKSCSYFTSNAFPLKLVFKSSNPKADPIYVMYKVGDDLRQDMLTLQVIRIMDMLWLQEGLDLRMLTFDCLSTGPKRGVIELITESETLRKIQSSSGVTGSFKDRNVKDWLQKHNPTELEYNKAVENFMLSCAGYCVATYVLGIGDRHNDNIMLKQSGHMFHIDFSKFLGDAQMFGNIRRDRVPFVLTPDMAYVINDGGTRGDRFQQFIDYCCQAFNIVRKHAALFRNMFMLMCRSGIPGVSEQSVMYIQRALLPGCTNTQAMAAYTRMIEESLKSKSTQFNFFIHSLAQLKFSSHAEGALLSFVPKTYCLLADGRILKAEVHSLQKRYTPEKHYVYILRVERENQRVPSFIFRLFAEFLEFRDKLAGMFPLVTWPNFSTRHVMGRSNIRAVAESRKTEIEHFLKSLMSMATEISECDLVYTFFHPLLRDEQEAASEKTNLNISKLRETPVSAGKTGIQGQIRLSIQYKNDALTVMIMHVRGLARGAELPSPYVKTYLLPDPDKQTKRKTKTAKNTIHPTYNEVLQYRMKEMELKYRTLQVTVWDHDMLKENNFLGAVYIRLRDLHLSQETVKWFPLQKLQMSGSGALA